MERKNDLELFYRNRKVLITGHTGFKGSWMCMILKEFGAEVAGVALKPSTSPSLFKIAGISDIVTSYTADVRNFECLREIFEKEQPEIVIHMAAQPLVRESYKNPVLTYETNVMGTVHVLECCRVTPSVKSVVNVTTDKVYRNNEWERGYVETDELDGYDPYSNSKSCSELVTHSYVQSFFQELGIPVSTCRAGNVIGGGDFAADRIIPDCVRAIEKGDKIVVRNPFSIRPYQHVLEPLFVYLMVAKAQYERYDVAGNYNVGPDDNNCITTGQLVDYFCKAWGNTEWINQFDGGPHEAQFLKLDCQKLKEAFHWKPLWSVKEAIEKIIEFEKIRISEAEESRDYKLCECMQNQIGEYMRDMNI